MTTIVTFAFLKRVLDTITEHIVVIDGQGRILYTNRAWSQFGRDNACAIEAAWQGVNYLDECDRAAATGDGYGTQAALGIRSVIDGERPLFFFEYPCHSPEEQRWFMMRVTPFAMNGAAYFVISHQNITERKLSEERTRHLSLMDELTQIANRRRFDAFVHEEWKRCQRQRRPMALALIDIDHFKLLNDTYGHQAGDRCLAQIAAKLTEFAQRPGDLCARYGGEEFALVYGDATLDQARRLADKLMAAIRSLDIPNKHAPTMPVVTASIGLAAVYPHRQGDVTTLIRTADSLLYSAKAGGRDTVVDAWVDGSAAVRDR